MKLINVFDEVTLLCSRRYDFRVAAWRLVLGLVLVVCYGSVEPFDVKVLIEKHSSSDEEYVAELSSTCGFIISDHATLSLGYECNSNNLQIMSKDGVLFLNGKPSSRKLLYVTPILSKAHIVQLNSYVSRWLEINSQDLNTLAEPLYSLFDQIVAHAGSAEPCDYSLLYLYVKEVAYIFSQDFLQTIETDHSVALATMSDYAEQFFQERVASLFLEGLASKQLTSKNKKNLTNDKAYRHAFFLAELHQVLQRLLYEFVPALPRKILQQFLKKDVGCIDFKGYSYSGAFVLFQEKKNFYFINSLDIDDYLLSLSLIHI